MEHDLSDLTDDYKTQRRAWNFFTLESYLVHCYLALAFFNRLLPFIRSQSLALHRNRFLIISAFCNAVEFRLRAVATFYRQRRGDNHERFFIQTMEVQTQKFTNCNHPITISQSKSSDHRRSSKLHCDPLVRHVCSWEHWRCGNFHSRRW